MYSPLADQVRHIILPGLPLPAEDQDQFGFGHRLLHLDRLRADLRLLPPITDQLRVLSAPCSDCRTTADRYRNCLSKQEARWNDTANGLSRLLRGGLFGDWISKTWRAVLIYGEKRQVGRRGFWRRSILDALRYHVSVVTPDRTTPGNVGLAFQNTPRPVLKRPQNH